MATPEIFRDVFDRLEGDAVRCVGGGATAVLRVGGGAARVASLAHLPRVMRLLGRRHDLLDVEVLPALSAGVTGPPAA